MDWFDPSPPRPSVGSLGRYENEMDVVGLVVKNCTIMHTANGLRIKTWPGSSKSRASGLLFEDINMIDVSNPIFIDQKYCPGNECSSEVKCSLPFSLADEADRVKNFLQSLFLCSLQRCRLTMSSFGG